MRKRSSPFRRLLCLPLLFSLPGPLDAQVPVWNAREVRRVGAIDGPAALADVFDAEFAADGGILVSQTRSGMAVFGPDGSYRRTVGRPGRGPGEFTFMSRIGWVGDTLWATDFGRLNTFDRDLRFIDVVAPVLADAPAGTSMAPGGLMAGGSVIFITTPGGSPDPDPPVVAADRPQRRHSEARPTSLHPARNRR